MDRINTGQPILEFIDKEIESIILPLVSESLFAHLDIRLFALIGINDMFTDIKFELYSDWELL